MEKHTSIVRRPGAAVGRVGLDLIPAINSTAGSAKTPDVGYDSEGIFGEDVLSKLSRNDGNTEA
jgi:hypothetical protein